MRTWFAVALAGVTALAAGGAEEGWKQVWADEFDKDGRPDSTKWGYEKGRVRNNELQYYTVDRAENARVEKGCLVIEGRRESFSNAAYTAASLITKGKAEWTHVRVEVRAQVPAARGTWPAIWMLGTNIRDAGWPRCGEIDIMEHVGHDAGVIHGSIHTAKYNHTKGTHRTGTVKVPDATTAFHVYAIEWTGARIDFLIDGKKYFSYEKEPGAGDDAWPYDKPHYLLLNLAIGGAWGGQKGVDGDAFPQRMLVDYVRVFAKR